MNGTRLRLGAAGLCTVVALLLAACGGKDRTPTEGPREAPASVKVVVDWPLPEFAYEDAEGRPFRKDDLEGKVWIANFFFVRCAGPCPEMTRAMAAIQREASGQPDLRLVSFTIRPESESAEELRRYAERFRADPTRWHFLRGPSDAAVADLQEKGFKAGGVGHHTPLFFLVDQKGAVRRFRDARDDAERALLIEDARLLLAGKPLERTLGPPAGDAR